MRLPGLEPGSGDDAVEWIAARRDDGKDDDAIVAELAATAAIADPVAAPPPNPSIAVAEPTNSPVARVERYSLGALIDGYPALSICQ